MTQNALPRDPGDPVFWERVSDFYADAADRSHQPGDGPKWASLAVRAEMRALRLSLRPADPALALQALRVA